MKFSNALLGAIAALGLSAPALATTYIPGTPQFQVTPCCGLTVFTAPHISGTIAVTTTAPGTFTDDFQFTIPQNGLGSGAITTSANSTSSSNFLNIESVTFDGKAVGGSYNNMGLFQFAGINNVAIKAFAVNDLLITYHTNGSGSYGGNLTFDASAVPEPATWATFVLGFALLGLGLRGRKFEQLKVA